MYSLIFLYSLPIQLYLVDTFTYAASALAAAAVSSVFSAFTLRYILPSYLTLIHSYLLQVFRSVLAFAFPLFGEQMYAALGYGGGNSLLAGLAIVVGIPFPIWLYYNGEAIRARSSLAR